MATLTITEDTTPDEIREALHNLGAAAHRVSRYDPRKGEYHAEINRLLELLDGPA